MSTLLPSGRGPRERCLITGCGLRLSRDTAECWGDLFLFGDRFIFNGLQETNGSARWLEGEASSRARALTIPFGEPYWERRGVFVLRASLSFLNGAAREYLQLEEGIPS